MGRLNVACKYLPRLQLIFRGSWQCLDVEPALTIPCDSVQVLEGTTSVLFCLRFSHGVGSCWEQNKGQTKAGEVTFSEFTSVSIRNRCHRGTVVYMCTASRSVQHRVFTLNCTAQSLPDSRMFWGAAINSSFISHFLASFLGDIFQHKRKYSICLQQNRSLIFFLAFFLNQGREAQFRWFMLH